MNREGDYTTVDECAFIDQLGKRSSLEERIFLVSLYIEASRLRTEWGDIEPEAVRTHAQGVLQLLQSQRPV